MSTTSNPFVRPAQSIEDIIKSDGRYPLRAYRFLHEGLERAVRAIHGGRRNRPQHVSGPQLCEALRELAIEQWGMMAGAVLQHWGIRGTRDFGEMVFFLVNIGVWGAQESDRVEDFDDVFDLHADLSNYEIADCPARR
ncbi:MAG: hypothetical protein JNG88_17095 [Phycisphaerales bacterium]|nr:hypothetical protein [Phycisphaerales bacterium]